MVAVHESRRYSCSLVGWGQGGDGTGGTGSRTPAAGRDGQENQNCCYPLHSPALHIDIQ